MSASGQPLEATTVLTVSAPAAGSDWTTTLTAPGTVMSVAANFSASAVVASRVPRLRLVDASAHVIWQAPVNTVLAASSNNGIVWGPGLTNIGLGGVVTQPLPSGVVFGVGWILSVSTANIDVGDQWANIVITLDNR